MVKISLSGKTAVVTGAVQGIGRSIAIRLAEAECRGIAILDLNINEEAHALAQKLKSLGSEVLLLEGDVSNCTDIKNCVDRTVERWGVLNILINNAGYAVNSDFFTTSEDQWNKVLGINLSSVFYGMKYAAEHMKEHGGGCIVNMSSISGITGGNTGPDYGASKAGIIALTKYGAKSLSSYNIRVNALAPGTIETPLINREYAKFDEKSLKRRLGAIPMGRMGSPDEVANVAAFLVSDLASYVNGETVMVTGGRMS